MIFWATVAIAQSLAQSVTPKTVRDLFQRYPAKKVVQILSKPETSGSKKNSFEKNVLEPISTGDEAWLRLAPKLATGTDAAASEGLVIALAQALEKNPAGVLKISGHALPLDRLCSAPFIEPTEDAYRQYLKASIQALEAVSSAELQQKRDACLSRLKNLAR